MFEKNDKVMYTVRIISYVAIVLMTGAIVITSIVLAFTTSPICLLISLAGLFMCWIMILSVKLLFSFLIDIKLIRNKLYGIANGELIGDESRKDIIIKANKIDSYAAYCNNTNLTNMSIPNGTTKIGDFAFGGCSSLKKVEIPRTVTSIGSMAFYKCSDLSEIFIPKEVVSIGSNAFKCCDNLTIYCEVDSKPSKWDNAWNSSNCTVVWGFSK